MGNLEDEDILKFVNLLVRIHNYDFENALNGLGRFDSVDDFFNYVNKKISFIEDNENLHIQLNETSTQLDKITNKLNKTEKTLVDTYNQNEENKTIISNFKIENDKLKKTIDELYDVKSQNEKIIMSNKEQYNELKRKYEEKKKIIETLSDKLVITQDIMEKIINKNNEYELNNNSLMDENNKLNKEVEEIDNIKKSLLNKLSSTEMITDLDTSIGNIINKSNEYQQKYNELNIKNGILQDNYNELNDKYNELFSNQTKETNELKTIIKQLTEQIEQDRIKYNENMIVREIKNNLEGGLKPPLLTPVASGGGGDDNNDDGTKYINIRDKKAIEYFDKDIKLYNEREHKNTNPNAENKKPISFTTDYMVDYMKVSEKMNKPNNHYNCETRNNLDTLQEIEISEEDEEEKPNNKIFMKNENNNDISLGCDYIDVSKLQIFKNEEGGLPIKFKKFNGAPENKQDVYFLGRPKEELYDFIKNNQDMGKIIYQKGGNKGKIEIKEFDGIKKLKFNDDYSTLTEQNIDLNDDTVIKKMKHRKYMRHSREQKKLQQLQEDL